jgi:hypothetical protein
MNRILIVKAKQKKRKRAGKALEMSANIQD